LWEGPTSPARKGGVIDSPSGTHVSSPGIGLARSETARCCSSLSASR